MPKTNLRHPVFIDALPSKVWKVLTVPLFVQQWMNAFFKSELKEGKEISLSFNGGSWITGKMLEIIPGVLLKYSLDEANQLVIYQFQLIPASNGIELQFTCSGFSDNDEAYRLRSETWQLQLQKLKWLAEFS